MSEVLLYFEEQVLDMGRSMAVQGYCQVVVEDDTLRKNSFAMGWNIAGCVCTSVAMLQSTR